MKTVHNEPFHTCPEIRFHNPPITDKPLGDGGGGDGVCVCVCVCGGGGGGVVNRGSI